MKPLSGAAHPSDRTCTHCMLTVSMSTEGRDLASSATAALLDAGAKSSSTTSPLSLANSGWFALSHVS